MFKARKTRLNFSQRSSQKSSNEENSTQNSNIPLGQQQQVRLKTFVALVSYLKNCFSLQVQQKDTEGDLFDDTESSFVAPSQEPSQTIQQIRTQRSQMRRYFRSFSVLVKLFDIFWMHFLISDLYDLYL